MNLIDKILKEYQEHFDKGNKTLGTLPNDWKDELNKALEAAFEAGRATTMEDADIAIDDPADWHKPVYNTFNDYLKTLEDETAKEI